MFGGRGGVVSCVFIFNVGLMELGVAMLEVLEVEDFDSFR